LFFARKSALLPEEAAEIKATDHKIDSAIALVESGENPMQGIFMLREVLAKDSTNVRVLLKMGEFSIKSGQMDKAVKHFDNVLKVEPNNIDALYYLGHLNAQKGDREKALTYFEKCLELSSDEQFTEELQGYINDLKNF
tara:strand:+ start:3422 stop:3838 length:417 start_codon:yes stop_codon:yes gene_type:complete